MEYERALEQGDHNKGKGKAVPNQLLLINDPRSQQVHRRFAEIDSQLFSVVDDLDFIRPLCELEKYHI